MSSLNGFNGQQGRPVARPTAEHPQSQHPQAQHPQSQHGQAHPHATTQQAAHPQSAHAWQPQQPQGVNPGQHWAQPGAPASYAPQGYGQTYTPTAAAAPRQPNPAYGGLSPNPDSYAPSFEPFAPTAQPRSAAPAYQPQSASNYQPQAAASQPYGQPGAYQTADPRTQPGLAHAGQPQASHQWPGQSAASHPANARGFDAGRYPQQTAAPYRAADPRQHDSEPAFSDWSQSQQPYAQQAQPAQNYDYGDTQYGQHQDGHDDMGFAQPAGGELEQGYDEEDEGYEVEEPSRGRRPLMIAAALAGAIFVGGGMSYGYKAFLGGAPSGKPPIIKSASEPSKIKPADAGGKQFAHTDSKIMGRLGDGDSAVPAAAAASAAGELDANGTRKVSTLVVGRDGSIQAPAAVPAPAAPVVVTPVAAVPTPPATSVSVPGMMVVDALGPRPTAAPSVVANAADTAAAASQKQAQQKLVVTPPVAPQKPITVAKAALAADPDVGNGLPEATGSIAPEAAAPAVKKPALKKVAAAAPTIANDAAPVAAPVTSGGANGYVAVLASVPRSTSSRMDALKRFADMQQKYGGVLGGKTPDVAEANLGAKGQYHRLVVGPPASREQASTLCTQLKSQGYADCWVTSY